MTGFPKKLKEKRKRLIKSIPNIEEIIRGTVFERYRKCGKKSCHCIKGKGHPMFCLGVTLSEGKTEQISLPKDLVAEVQRRIENYQQLCNILGEVCAINRQWVRLQRQKKR